MCSICLDASLFAVFSFTVPGGEVLGGTSRWFQRILLGCLPVHSEDVSASSAVAFVPNYSPRSIFAGLRFLSDTFSSTWLFSRSKALVVISAELTRCAGLGLSLCLVFLAQELLLLCVLTLN